MSSSGMTTELVADADEFADAFEHGLVWHEQFRRRGVPPAHRAACPRVRVRGIVGHVLRRQFRHVLGHGPRADHRPVVQSAAARPGGGLQVAADRAAAAAAPVDQVRRVWSRRLGAGWFWPGGSGPGGSGPGSNCVLAGTPVVLADGSIRAGRGIPAGRPRRGARRGGPGPRRAVACSTSGSVHGPRRRSRPSPAPSAA